MTTISTNNPMTFHTNVKQLIKGYNQRARNAVAGAIMDVRNHLINTTPVDTGFAQASWWDTAKAGARHPRTPSFQQKMELRTWRGRRGKVRGGRIGTYWGWYYKSEAPIESLKTGNYFLYNSAAYIKVLEDSHPIARGFIQRAQGKFTQFLQARLNDRTGKLK